MTDATAVAPTSEPPLSGARMSFAWLGVVPFLLFALLALILPTLEIVIGSFTDQNGGFTLANIANLFQPSILDAYWISIRISLASAFLGCLFGFLIAVAVGLGGLPPWMRSPILTFSGVASNFAGIPLAFAFLATLGRLGFVTVILRDWFGINIYTLGFNLLSFSGLTITYLFFQIPLMVLIVMPAVDGLRREWREAADILGASSFQYWRMVAIPILWPSLLGTFALLFANSFGAVATAYALTGSSLNIVPILLFAQIRGDVMHNQNLGYALALGMVLVTGLSNGGYIWLRSRAERGRR